MFVPYDQWVTIQIALSHYDGWEYVLYDQNGKAITRDARPGFNLNKMQPKGTMELFNDFNGYADTFKLYIDRPRGLPSTLEELKQEDCLFNLDFQMKSILGDKVSNLGKEKDLVFSKFPQLIYLPFNQQETNVNSGSVRGTY